MLRDTDLFVVLKLVSGEQVMAVLRSEDEMFIEIESPMCIKSVPTLETNREHITAQPLCQFTDDVNYTLDKKDVMFIKKMHYIFIPHYMRIVEEHEKLAEVNASVVDRSTQVKETIQALKEHLAKKEEETFRNYVEGNDTIN
jgi:CRISPR/Cas system CSM-associated protein Csm4 (group 5 of RAMP superfamily)